VSSAGKRVRVTIRFGFTFDWSRKWRESLKPVTERSKENPKETKNNWFLHWHLLFVPNMNVSHVSSCTRKRSISYGSVLQLNVASVQ